MARKKKQQDGGGSGDWLNTYADMVTLLLTFFILLFSMSTLNAEKINLLAEAFQGDGGASGRFVVVVDPAGDLESISELGPNEELSDQDQPAMDMTDMYNDLMRYLTEESLSDKVEVAMGEGEILIRFTDDMLFEPDQATLKPEHLALLKFVGDGIKSVQQDAKQISIIGYTAAMPDDPDYGVSDRTLSTDRANAVLMYFESREVGVDPTKLMATGWGKNKPIADNDTEENRAKNRRVEILISGEDVNTLSDQLDNMYNWLIE